MYIHKKKTKKKNIVISKLGKLRFDNLFSDLTVKIWYMDFYCMFKEFKIYVLYLMPCIKRLRNKLAILSEHDR